MEILRQIYKYINDNDIEKAYNLIKNNEEKYMKNDYYWNCKGMLFVKAQEYIGAIECFKKSININKFNEDSYYNLAYSYEKSSDLSEAALNYGLAYKYTNNEAYKIELKNIFKGNIELEQIFEVAASKKNKRFILLSSCSWGKIHQRMHHIARSLSKFGCEVIYVEPARGVEGEEVSNEEIINLSLKDSEVIENVNIVRPINIYKNNFMVNDGYTNVIQKIFDIGDTQTTIITYMPYQANILKNIKSEYIHIYDCVDDHSDLEYSFWSNKMDHFWEPELMDSADFIITTATSLYLKRVVGEKRKNVYLCRNAVNFKDFRNDYSEELIPEEFLNIPEPRIVYVGAIYEWFDDELFESVIKQNPDKSFVVIGFGKENILKKKYENLYIIGAKEHKELSKYIRNCQVGIIPFKYDLDLIVNCDPIKQYEYLACDIPVITTNMAESGLGKINTYQVNNIDEFNNAIELSLNSEREFTRNIEFIYKNSWNLRAADIYMISEGKKFADDIFNIEKQIDKVENWNENPNYLSFKSQLFRLDNNKLSIVYAEKSYKLNRAKYYEREYLRSLFYFGNTKKLIEVIEKSINIAIELKIDIRENFNKKDEIIVNIILFIILGEYNSAIKLIYTIEEKRQILYINYIKYFIKLEVSLDEVINMEDVYKSNMIYHKIYSYIEEECSIEKNNGNYMGKETLDVIKKMLDQNKVEETLEFIINQDDIKEEIKMEIIYLVNMYPEKIGLAISYYIGDLIEYDIIDYNIRDYNLANNYFNREEYSKAMYIYKNIENKGLKDIISRPIFKKNYYQLLRLNGEFNKSEIYKFDYLKSRDLLINECNTYKQWVEIFNCSNDNCPVCSCYRINTVMNRADGNIIIKCDSCGISFLKNMPTIDNIEKIYNSDYYNNDGIGGYSQYNSNYNESIMIPKLKWIENSQISKGKKMLDIGCANGQFLEYAKASNWICEGLEISHSSYESAIKKGLKVYNNTLKNMKISSYTFDCITLWDVIEHYIDPVKELKEIYRILKKDGKLYISTPNNLKGVRDGVDWFGYNASYEHLFYFEPDTLISMLKNVGFKIDDCFSYESDDPAMKDIKGIGHILAISCRK